MTDQQPGDRGLDLFAGVVPDEAVEAYRKLAESGGVPEEDAAKFLGGEQILRQLLDLGMAFTPNPVGKTVAAPERMAILAVTNHAHRNLITSLNAVCRLARAAYERDDGYIPGTALPDMFEFYTDRDEITGVSLTLINKTRREYLALDNLHRESRLTKDSKVGGVKELHGSIIRRCVYDQDFMRHPAGRQLIHDSIAAGEEARLYPGIEMKMQICDTSAALLPCTLSGMGGAVLVRAEPIILGLRQLFRLTWAAAVPVSGKQAKDDPLTGRRREVLDLLAVGLHAPDIAKQLGLSKSMVHKYVEDMSSMLSAKGPWQAGMEAHRRGWVA